MRARTILAQLRAPRTVALSLSALILAACSGGGADTPSGTDLPTSTAPNRPPIVDAGGTQAAQGGGIVLLRGFAHDPEGDALNYVWRQTDGLGVVLEDADSPIAKFEAPAHVPAADLAFELEVTDDHSVSAADTTSIVVTTGYTSCPVTSPPAILDVDPWFYQKYCDGNGHPVLAPLEVPDLALQWVRHQMLEMLKRLPLAAQEMIRHGSRVAIKNHAQLLTEIPEFSDLYADYPGFEWDALPGVGAVIGRAVTATTEENVLCHDDDPYKGYSVFIHEFAHSIHLIGLATMDPTFEPRLKLAYETAMASGLWAGTYAARNDFEYWAEGVTIWFNAHWSESNEPGVIDTREELAQHDDGLYRLIREYFTEDEIPACPPPSILP